MSFYQLFKNVSFFGYSFLGRTVGVPSGSTHKWQFEPGLPPSYDSQGRFRFLKTLEIEKEFRPKRVLEIAAGGGFNAICLYENDIEIVINDIRELNDEFKCFKNWDKIKFIKRNLFELSSEQIGQFDLIVCCEVIEHVAHGREFVKVIKELLTPNGKVIVTTPNGDYFGFKLPTFGEIKDFKQFENMQFLPDGDGHLYLYRGQELIDLMEEFNLSMNKLEYHITPFLSGHRGLRFLPKSKFLFSIYYFFNILLTKIYPKKFCSQLIAVFEKRV